MSREEKRDATAVWQLPLRVLLVIFTGRERSFPDRFAKISFGGGFEEDVVEVAAFTEDAAEDFGVGEDELSLDSISPSREKFANDH